MIEYYHLQLAHPPPPEYTPNAYHPPNMTLILIVLVIMGLELFLVGWFLRPWKRENLKRRILCLASLNFFWAIFSGLIVGFRPPFPMKAHFGWLVLLEIVLVVDISVAVIRWLLRSVYRAIRRLPWPRIR